jgi:hypothetical protein
VARGTEVRSEHREEATKWAFVVAMIALFVALGGTAGAVVTAAVPLAKRALVADNAKKVGGLTAAQVAAAGARASVAVVAQALPSAATSLVSTQTAPFSLAAGAEQVVTASCGTGSKALAGGFVNPTTALVVSAGSTPTSDGTGWSEDLINLDSATTGSGTVVATCLK